MNSTRITLLTRAGDGSERAWQELIQLYQSLVASWLRTQTVAHHDAEEISQDVMTFVAQNLSSFDHSGRVGAFRKWLREIMMNRVRAFWRRKQNKADALGGSVFQQIADGLHDPASDLSIGWNREHDAFLLRRILAKVQNVFQPETFEVFRRLVFEEALPNELASEFNLSIGAVYSARSRVLRKLREEAAGLLDLDELGE